MNFSIAALLIAVSTANASPKLRGSSKSGKLNEFTNPSDMDDECNPGNKLEARGGMSVMAIGALKQYEVDMAKVVHSKSKVRLPSTPLLWDSTFHFFTHITCTLPPILHQGRVKN